MKREMNSGAFSLRLMNVSKAYRYVSNATKTDDWRAYLVQTALQVTVALERLRPDPVKSVLEVKHVLNPLEGQRQRLRSSIRWPRLRLALRLRRRFRTVFLS